MFAARGVPVVAVEPSPAMAVLLAGLPGVVVERGDFEAWDPRGRSFPLVYSAQAWHWVKPEVGYARAAAALETGGWLAAFWNRPDWERSELRPALLAAYELAAPDAERDGPMHPASTFRGREEDWLGEIAALGASLLGGVSVREYAWSLDYSAEDYAGLLATTSELQLMAPEPREALLRAVRAAIGAGISLPMSTRLCLACRVD
jgi:hypothetical protein